MKAAAARWRPYHCIERIVQAGLIHPEAVHTPNIATGMILAIFIKELQERLIAFTNAGSFPG